VIWQSLHNALRHEDKAILPALCTFTILAALICISRGRVRPMIAIVDSRIDYLRRGIAPYRVFG
jgi:hypothetical protein